MKAKIEDQFRLSKPTDETVDHMIDAYSKIAQADYKECYNTIAAMLHWDLARRMAYHPPENHRSTNQTTSWGMMKQR